MRAITEPRDIRDPWRLIEERWEEYVRAAGLYLEQLLRDSDRAGYVFGLSGGLDSSVLALLLRRALGRDRALALIMPDEGTPLEDLRDAIGLAESFDIPYLVINISPILRAFHATLNIDEERNRTAVGNVKARARAAVLYYFANARNLLVASSTDRSEYLLGYFTKWGDIAGDVHPLLLLYKTQVRALGRALGVPESVLSKPSSPGFWPGQRAEDELGAPYELIDKVLYMAVDRQMPLGEIARELNVDERVVNNIWERVTRSGHKRLPVSPITTAYAALFEKSVKEVVESR